MAGAAGYGGLIQAGVGLAAAIMTKPNTDAVYSREYSQTMAVENAKYANNQNRRRNGEIQHYAELSVASAVARGVKQRTIIGLNQAQAEAMLRVNAAAAGVSGGSVDDTIYQTEANAAFRVSDQSSEESNTIEGILGEMYSNKNQTILSEDRGPKSDYSASLLGAAMQGVSNVLDGGFMTDLGLALEDSPTSKDAYTVNQRRVDATDIQSEPGGRGGV